MGNTFGRQIIGVTGTLIQLIAAGDPEWKTGGITIDWSTITAVGADTTLPEGLVVKSGAKYLRYGQVLCEIGTQEVQTATITGTPDGGTFTLTYSGQTTAAIAYNATAAAVQDALEALSNIAVGDVFVTGNAGGPYTIKFRAGLGNVAAITASGAGLTGGTSPGVTMATTTTGAGSGKFGPYDPAATDGRQTLARGRVVILNESVVEYGALGLGGVVSDHPGGLEGGTVWRDRLIATEGGTSLTNGPLFSALETALPRLRYAM